MKRTYPGILGEYYDNQSDTWEKMRVVSVTEDKIARLKIDKVLQRNDIMRSPFDRIVSVFLSCNNNNSNRDV